MPFGAKRDKRFRHHLYVFFKSGVVRKEEKFLNTKQILLELEKGDWKISKGLGVEGK